MREAGNVDGLQSKLAEREEGLYSPLSPCFCPLLSLGEFFHGKVTESLIFPIRDIHSLIFILLVGRITVI